MPLMFPFTFIFNVPGLINPFAESNSHSGASKPRYAEQYPPPPPQILHKSINRPHYPPSPPPSSQPISRKRGWQPTFAEPSRSTTTLASTSGYLDVRSRPIGHCQMGSSWSSQYSDVDQDVQEDMPPLKKRRGLAGTIISTAVNAALIGGAVGLTVYRLWRNRGKQPPQEQIEAAPESIDEPPLAPLPPPPPYEASPSSTSKFIIPHSEQQQPSCATMTPRGTKKIRHSQLTTRQAKRPAVVYNRRKKATHHHHHHSSSTSSDPFSSSTRSEFDLSTHRNDVDVHVQQDEVVDKMDWIGDKLSMLIQQGKKALGSQVVVMSDAKEDEVDDGSPAWEEEEEEIYAAEGSRCSSPRHSRNHSRSRSGSVRQVKRPRALNIAPGSLASAQMSGSPPSSTFGHLPSSTSAPNTASRSVYGFGVPTFNFQQTTTSTSSSLPTSYSMTSLHHVRIEDPGSFESPELREGMERARQRLMARRMGGT